MCVRCTPISRTQQRSATTFGRRSFLATLGASLAALSLPLKVSAAQGWADAARTAVANEPQQHSPYALWLVRMQTGEEASAAFSLDGKSIYWPGYAKLCGILRDVHVPIHEGDVQISMRTIEALWGVQQYLIRSGIQRPIVVHSGYRTPQTNAATEGAARNSLHMWGMAVDFHVPNVAMQDLAGICLACPARGGVGYYPDGWVHLDSGPRRYWSD